MWRWDGFFMLIFPLLIVLEVAFVPFRFRLSTDDDDNFSAGAKEVT